MDKPAALASFLLSFVVVEVPCLFVYPCPSPPPPTYLWVQAVSFVATFMRRICLRLFRWPLPPANWRGNYAVATFCCLWAAHPARSTNYADALKHVSADIERLRIPGQAQSQAKPFAASLPGIQVVSIRNNSWQTLRANISRWIQSIPPWKQPEQAPGYTSFIRIDKQ